MLKLHIPVMTCNGCKSKVRKALASSLGSIASHLTVARMIQVNGTASEMGIIQAIEAVGFSVNRITA